MNFVDYFISNCFKLSNMELIPYLIVIFGVINLIRMGLFLIGSDLYDLKNSIKRKKDKVKAPLPFFTVVIPAYNEQGSIIRSIKSVLDNDYPKNKLRIVVVDDGSTDNSKKVLKSFKKDHKVENLFLIFQKNQGKAMALNNAIKKYAQGELVMCLDGDSTINPDALKNAAWYFNDKKVVAVASNVRIMPTGTLLNLIQRFEYIVCYQMKRAQSLFNIEYIIGGIGSTFRLSFISKVGYYDGDTITEDIDLTMKILQHGNRENRVIYGSDVIANTESVLSIKDLMKQRFRWKWGRSQTFYKNRNLFFNSDRRFSKPLTWLYLPYALYSDIAFFLEPLIIGYIFYIVIAFGDIITLLSAVAVVSLYTSLNVLLENTLSRKERLMLLPFVPSMYIFFYILSYVEYYALIKMLVGLPKLKSSIAKRICSWTHVERSSTANLA